MDKAHAILTYHKPLFFYIVKLCFFINLVKNDVLILVYKMVKIIYIKNSSNDIVEHEMNFLMI